MAPAERWNAADLDPASLVSLKLRSDPRMLAVVRAVVRSFGAVAGFDEARVAAIALAVDEGCANIIRHAYGGRTDGDVEMTCGLSRREDGSTRLIVRLHDRGQPAPRECVEQPCRHKDLNEPGGLGVRLIHEVMDGVEFEPSDDEGNTLLMWVACPAVPGSP